MRMRYEQQAAREDTDDFDVVMSCLEVTRVNYSERLVCGCVIVQNSARGDNSDLWKDLLEAVEIFEGDLETRKTDFLFDRILENGLAIHTTNFKSHIENDCITKRMLLKFSQPVPDVCILFQKKRCQQKTILTTPSFLFMFLDQFSSAAFSASRSCEVVSPFPACSSAVLIQFR